MGKRTIRKLFKFNLNIILMIRVFLKPFLRNSVIHFRSCFLYLCLCLLYCLSCLYKSKALYYVDHVIYAVHLYCALFILLFILMGISQMEPVNYLPWLRNFTVPLLIYTIWYQYKSLRNFYDQGRLKTVIKYLFLLIMSSVVMSLLFIVFLVLSVFNL